MQLFSYFRAVGFVFKNFLHRSLLNAIHPIVHKDGFEKDHKQAINDILTSKDDVYVSAFNLDRSVEMSQLLLLADYVRANKTIDNNVRKN